MKKHTPFSAELRKYRTDHGLTQATLAKKIGVSWRTYARWEAGDAKPRGVGLIANLKKLGLAKSF